MKRQFLTECWSGFGTPTTRSLDCLSMATDIASWCWGVALALVQRFFESFNSSGHRLSERERYWRSGTRGSVNGRSCAGPYSGILFANGTNRIGIFTGRIAVSSVVLLRFRAKSVRPSHRTMRARTRLSQQLKPGPVCRPKATTQAALCHVLIDPFGNGRRTRREHRGLGPVCPHYHDVAVVR